MAAPEPASTAATAVPPADFKPAVFLDRDGTLNAAIVRDGRPYSPQALEEFRVLPDSPAACARLAAAGFVLVVVTNQPDVGRGLLSSSAVESMHARLRAAVPQIARIEICHATGDTAAGRPDRRRKPEPGMLLDAARDLGLDLARSWMVGDRWRDVDCGQRAGVRTIFIERGYTEELRARPDFSANSLAEAAGIILAHREAQKLNSTLSSQ